MGGCTSIRSELGPDFLAGMGWHNEALEEEEKEDASLPSISPAAHPAAPGGRLWVHVYSNSQLPVLTVPCPTKPSHQQHKARSSHGLPPPQGYFSHLSPHFGQEMPLFRRKSRGRTQLLRGCRTPFDGNCKSSHFSSTSALFQLPISAAPDLFFA